MRDPFTNGRYGTWELRCPEDDQEYLMGFVLHEYDEYDFGPDPYEADWEYQIREAEDRD